ncbi:MAG: acylphosphatase [Elusimicrobia bacterium]|nr:acylphosphatase [Elusimicrobiota bacterium]
MNLERVYFRVRGKVQGVGFRWFVRDTARELLLTGWTRNVLDGSVEGEIQGSRDKITLFLKDIKIKHSWADVSSLETEARQTLSEKEFTIRLTV